MKNYFLLFMIGLLGLGWTGVSAQVTYGTGGLIGPNSPTTNLNVGIGFTDPQAKLDVRSEIRVTAPAGTNNLSFSTPGAFHVIRATNNMNMQMDNGGSLSFVLGGFTRTTMLSNGRVGIGTVSPSQILHVVGNTATSGYACIGTTTTSGAAPKLQVHNGSIMVSGTNASGGPMITFSENVAAGAYPNGRYGVEYIPNVGLNFWQPWNPVPGGGSNYNMLIRDDRKVGVGIDPTIANSFPNGYLLYVKDGILTEKLKIAIFGTANWADHVFADDYQLMPLEEVETFVNAHDHLPNVPSAQSLVDQGGIEVEKMMAQQMAKIEELTLYIIAQNKRLASLEAQMDDNCK
jgi:hypothetical protein